MDTADTIESLPSATESTVADCASRTHRGPSRSLESRIRRQKIREHHTTSLTRTDTRASTFGCVTADLLEIEHIVGGVVLRLLRGRAVAIDEIEECKPAIDLVLRVTKLATQTCRLETEPPKDSPENSPAALPESASEEIANCAPTLPGGSESSEVTAEGSSDLTEEVADA
jgi:hypothetical protein